MFLMVRLLVALSSLSLIAAEQLARLDKALATQANRDAAKAMADTQDGSEVLRVDVYDEMLVLSGGSSMPSGFIYIYSVFADQAAIDKWVLQGDFKGDKLMFPSGLGTQVSDDGLVAYPKFFFAKVAPDVMVATKAAFAKIAGPTRNEVGVSRYDNACTLEDAVEPFCLENIWYKTLPKAQQDHNGADFMIQEGGFFQDIKPLNIEWGMANLQVRNKGPTQVRVSSAPKSTANLAAAQKMWLLARVPFSGVVRFNMYDEQLVLSDGSFFPSMKLLTYAVFGDERDEIAWNLQLAGLETDFPGISTNFKNTDMIMADGITTDTQNADTATTNPIFFWVTVLASDFEVTKGAFAGIVTPTRDEPGVVRYDNACQKSADTSTTCYENVEYTVLPDSQDAHMSTDHMGTFFAETANVVIGWGMSTLTPLVPEVPTPTGFIQYLRIAEHATIISTNPDCDFWRAEDLGRQVPDKCCDLTKWPEGSGASQTPPSSRAKDTDPKKWACYVLQRVPPNDATYTRNYLGCEAGVLMAAEGCAPTGTEMGSGYPMNETFAAASWIDGTFDSCNCEAPAFKGNGCYVAATSFMKGLGSDTFANFAQLGNDDCATATVT